MKMKAEELLAHYAAGKRSFAWAILRGANLRGADLCRANLRGANLRGADLCRANLRWANLRGADLRDVNLCGAIGNGAEIQSAQFSKYPVAWAGEALAIGCRQHPVAEWMAFSTEAIAAMAYDAAEWWAQYRPVLVALGALPQ